MPVEVLPGGNVRVFDDEGRFVAGYGAAAAKQLGLTEPTAKDVLRSAATQLQSTVTRGTKQGSIEIGDQQFTTEPDEREREAAAVAQDALSALQGVAPLVQSGLADADTIRQLVGRSVSDSFSDQRLVRKAARDMQTVQRLANNGTHSQLQTMKVLESMEAEYGPETLMRVPGYADFVGLRQQLEAAREESLTEFAAGRGLDRRYVQWDERFNRPTYNTQEFAVDEYKAGIQKDQLGSLTAPIKAKVDSLTGQISAVTKAIQNAQTSGQDPAPLLRQHLRLTNELFGAYRQIDQLAGAGAQRAQETVEQPPEVETDLNAAIDSAPASPLAQAAVTLTFDTKEAAEAAAKQGLVPVGKVFNVAGKRAMLNNTGRFVRVQ